MSSLASRLKESSQVQRKDVVGGYTPLESNIYMGTIKHAYLFVSEGGSTGCTLEIEWADGSKFTPTVYVTNKAGETTYTDRNKNVRSMAGFDLVNDICMISTEAPLSAQETEEKTIQRKVDGRDAAVEVEVLVDLIDKPVCLAIIKQKSFKQTKAPDGTYVDTTEVRLSNEVIKAFNPAENEAERVTVTEALNEIEEAVFYHDWLKQWKGKESDRTSGKAAKPGAAPRSGSPSAAASGKPSLFAKK